MKQPVLVRILCVLLCLVGWETLSAQKIITYSAGMGTRDPENADVWILYQRVRAEHEGMVLYADSALLNTEQNDFTAYGHIKIELTDTTTIYGDRLYYDGISRVVDIWADTVRLIDGKTILKTNHLSYDRNTSTATYNNWGYTVNEDKSLVSRVGHYNSDIKTFYIYVQVVLQDSNMRLETDTLTYCTEDHIAEFSSPTYIYSDSSILYSENGSYNTETRYAYSTKSSRVQNMEKILSCDTLHYYEATEFGRAIGHVVLEDTVNKIICMGRYGESDRVRQTSYVTDSALVKFVGKDENNADAPQDTLYLHADSIRVINNENKEFTALNAFYHVKAFRTDGQAMCDSAHYSVLDSLLQLYGNPVLWYGDYQCTADTIEMYHGSDGPTIAYMRNNSINAEQLDPAKFNQIKGRNSEGHFLKGEPNYADILGNAEMVYYITDEDSGRVSVVGVNVGQGSDMRIYFKDRSPERVVTSGNPDMNAYPLDNLDPEKSTLQGFRWLDARRPKSPGDVFVW